MIETSRRAPVRTCLGCRRRDEQSTLLRVVGVREGPNGDRMVVIQPDPGGHMQARGAYVHLNTSCAKAAVQRRAFGRALRMSGELNTTAVLHWIEQHEERSPQEGPHDRRGDQPCSPSLEAG